MRSWLRPPGGDLTLWALVFLVGGLFIAVRSWQGWLTIGSASALVSIVVGVGFWRRQWWARYLGLAYVAANIVLSALLFAPGWRFWAMLVLGGLGMWLLWKLDVQADAVGDPDEEDDEDAGPMHSVVAFVRELPYLDRHVLARSVSKAWGVEITGDEDAEATSFVLGEGTPYFVQHDGTATLVHHMDRPYFDDPDEAVEQIPELRLKQAIAEQQAWVAVDRLFPRPENEAERSEAYAQLGRLLAELIDEDCLALFFPETGAIRAFHPFHLDLLRGGHALQVLEQQEYAPVVGISDDDPRMQQAVATARARWPEFVAAFECRKDGQTFSVKSPVSDGEATEFIWVSVTAIEHDTVFGTLANEPVSLKGMALDDPVRVPAAELNDWCYVDPDKDELQGGFTVKILTEVLAQAREQAERDEAGNGQ